MSAIGSHFQILSYSILLSQDYKPDTGVIEHETDGAAAAIASDSHMALTTYNGYIVRDAVDYLQTWPHYVNTLSQLADLLTEPGSATSLELYGDLLGCTGACPQTRQLFPGIKA